MLGVVLARQQVDVAARSEGRLEAVLCRLGDRVEKDSVLATVDTRSVKRELAIAEAQRRVANAELGGADLELAESRERLEKRRLQHAEKVISGDEMATAEFREKKAAGPGLQIAQARLSERRARVEQLQQELADAEIRAPFAGTVAVRYVDTGAAVTRGTPIVRLIGTADLRVRFAVPEERAAMLKVAMPLQIHVDGFATPYQGEVEKIAPEVEAASRMIFAEAKFIGFDAGFEDSPILSGRVVRVLPAPAGATASPPRNAP
jgi:RND family efflux transporter MFP subunit